MKEYSAQHNTSLMRQEAEFKCRKRQICVFCYTFSLTVLGISCRTLRHMSERPTVVMVSSFWFSSIEFKFPSEPKHTKATSLGQFSSVDTDSHDRLSIFITKTITFGPAMRSALICAKILPFDNCTLREFNILSFL